MKSSVPTFKAALLARLKTALNPLQVVWGNPDPVPMQDKIVSIGATKGRKLDYIAAMTQANESYEVEVLVSVQGSALRSTEAMAEEAWAIASMVETSVLEWAAIGYDGVVNIAVPSEAVDEETIVLDPTPGKTPTREVSVTLTLSVLARIS